MTILPGTNEVLKELGQSIDGMLGQFAARNEVEINKIPYEGSWTAAQLLRHVTKSIYGMAGAMAKPGKETGRDKGERIDELRKVFLDLSKKMTSPEFIEPEDGPFEKKFVIGDINNAVDQFTQNVGSANLSELVEGLPLGPITKLEILHFVLFHTERHALQLKKICDALAEL